MSRPIEIHSLLLRLLSEFLRDANSEEQARLLIGRHPTSHKSGLHQLEPGDCKSARSRSGVDIHFPLSGC